MLNGWKASAILQPSQTAERMVRMEIQASETAGKRDVGEPIAIVRLEAVNGLTLEKIGACREI